MCLKINAFALSGRIATPNVTQGVALGYAQVGLSARPV